MKKILVVEDNEQNSDLLKDVLETWGYEVRIAAQGLEVMPMSLEFSPDIILLDIMLPGMSGFEVCTALRNHHTTKSLPVIMCSVLSDLEDRAHAYSVGADNYLTKPINYNELKQIIDSALIKKQYMDSAESRLAVSRMLLDLACAHNPNLKERNKSIKRLCERLLARNSIKVDPEKVSIVCNLLGVTNALGQSSHAYLQNLNAANWLIKLLSICDPSVAEKLTDEQLETLKYEHIYWEWQIIKVACFFQYELDKGKIPRNLIIDVYRKQLQEEGCDKLVLDAYEKIFISEEMLYNIKV